MCWFKSKKKDKEKTALLEQKVKALENQVLKILAILKALENQVLKILAILEDLNETDGRLAAENYQLKNLITSHIKNDMDMTEGDETTWEEN